MLCYVLIFYVETERAMSFTRSRLIGRLLNDAVNFILGY